MCNPIRVVSFRGVLPVWLDRGRKLVGVRIRASTEEALAKMDRVGVRNRVRIRVRVRVRERTEEALAEVVDDREAGGDADDVLDARAPPLGVDLASDQLVGRAVVHLLGRVLQEVAQKVSEHVPVSKARWHRLRLRWLSTGFVQRCAMSEAAPNSRPASVSQPLGPRWHPGHIGGCFRHWRAYVAKVSTMPCADMPVRTETRASRAAGDASARRMYGTSATTPPLVRSIAVDASESAGAGAGAAAWRSVLGTAPCANRFTAGRGEAPLAEPNSAAARTRTEKVRIIGGDVIGRSFCDQGSNATKQGTNTYSG